MIPEPRDGITIAFLDENDQPRFAFTRDDSDADGPSRWWPCAETDDGPHTWAELLERYRDFGRPVTLVAQPLDGAA